MKKDNIDELFRMKLHDIEEYPPEYIWDNICTQLNKQKKKKTMIWIWSSVASILLLITFGSGYYFASRKFDFKQQFFLNKITSSSVQENQMKLTQSIENLRKESDNIKISKQPIPLKNNTNSFVFFPKGMNKKNNNIEQKELSQNFDKLGKMFKEKNSLKKNSFSEVNILKDSNFFSHNVEKKEVSKIETIFKDTLKSKNQNETTSLLAVNINVPKVVNQGDKWYLNCRVTSGFEKASSSSTSNQVVYNVNSSKIIGIKDSNIIINSNTLLVNNINTNQLFVKNNVQPVIHYDRLENARIIVSGGLSIGHYVSNRLGVQCGVYYLKKECYLNDGLFQSMQYVEVPITLKYKLLNKRLNIYLSGGISPSFLIFNKTFLVHTSDGSLEHIGKLSNVNEIDYIALAGLGLNYSLFKHLSLFTEPSIRYSFRSVIKNYSGKRYPFNGIIYIGIYVSI